MSYLSESNLREGETTRLIERQAARLPSAGYLGFAIGSMALSATIAFVLKKRDLANFVGLWAPSILVVGLYNKLVKIEHELAHTDTSDFNRSFANERADRNSIRP